MIDPHSEQTGWAAFYAQREADDREKKYLLRLLQPLHEAVTNEGLCPALHREVMHQHRIEWPTLWKAIDRLTERYEELNAD